MSYRAGEAPPKSEAIVVRCVVVRDGHRDKHAFKFDWSPTKLGARVASFHELTAQVHEWAKTQPFEVGESLHIFTSELEDPGAARLGPILSWGIYVVEEKS